MEISRRNQWSSIGSGKSVDANACPRVRSAVSTSMRRVGIKVQSKASNLGVLFQPGARTKASKAVSTVKRRIRARRLGARLGMRVFRTGILPASSYDSTVAYPGKGTLAQMRVAAAAVLGLTKGISVTARLAIHQCDPARYLAMRAIKTWVDAVWDQQVEATVMSSAWRRAKNRFESSAMTPSACGAAGAFLIAIKQVEWASPAYNVLITRQGQPLRLETVDPKTVLRHLADD